MRFVCAQEYLKPGLYRLLDLCGEYEVALLHAVLKKGARELMRALRCTRTTPISTNSKGKCEGGAVS